MDERAKHRRGFIKWLAGAAGLLTVGAPVQANQSAARFSNITLKEY